MHAAVDILGHLLAPHFSPADDQEEELAETIQEATGESVQLAYVDQAIAGAAGGRGREARHPAGGGQTR